MAIASSGEFAARLKALRGVMESQGADLTIFGLSSGMKYLTGFSDEPGERMLLLIVPREGLLQMLVPRLYEDQVHAHEPCAEIHAWDDGEDPRHALGDVAQRLPLRCKRILIDDMLWASFVLPLIDVFPQCEYAFASDSIATLRMIKDPKELDSMRRAGEIADRALASVLEERLEGRTERQLALLLESTMLAEGAESIAFETLVASGPNSAIPHHRADSRMVAGGDVVILDFGCRCDGYCSDISRTVVCGYATDDVRRAHAAVLSAHDRAIAAVMAGQEAQAVDHAARNSLEQDGLAAWFTHRTGHGIGLDIHEPPYIVHGDRTELQSGMTFSVEPGVYFPKRYGIRVEDVVAVTDRGATSMTEAPRELLEIH